MKLCSTYSRLVLVPALLLLGAFTSFGQVTVTNNLNPQDLVQNVLAGPGVQISNVTYNGVLNPPLPQLGTGEFDVINSNLGIPDGVILTSGDALDIDDVATGFMSNTNSTGTDADLQSIAGGVTINDVAVLEFDFIPIGDSIIFDYVFGSEEYPEFVCSFNDAFGFFLSGPGINGPYTNNAENIALVPGTMTPVTIDNINNGLNNNPFDPNCPAVNPQYYIDNSTGTTIVFDGFTTVLQARAAVQCGQTYHIKLAIGDALDNAYDSGVFLAGGSFTSQAVEVEVTGAVSSDSSIIEGCTNAFIQIIRPDTVGVDTVIYDIAGNAINGVDYTWINDTIFFASGQDTATVFINPIDDGIPDGPDTLIITAYTITPCGDTIPSTGVIYIVDSIPYTVSAPDVTLFCPLDSVPIFAISDGDPQDYTYDWSTGDFEISSTGSTVWVPMPASPTQYTVVVTDTCGNSVVTDTLMVIPNLQPPPTVDAGLDTTTTCALDPVNLLATGASGVMPYSYSWSSGGTAAAETVTPSVTTVYYVTITDSCGTTNTDSVTVNVVPIPPILTLPNDTTLACPGDGLLINASASSGAPPYTYQWSTGQSANQIFVFPPVGTTYYTVTVTDVCDATGTTDSIAVTIPDHPPIDAGLVDQTSVCPGDNIALLSNISGGAGGYTWVWSTGSTDPDITVSPGVTTSYDITITDMCGEDTTQSVTVTVPVYDPLVVTASDDELICLGNSTGVQAMVAGGAGQESFLWTGAGLLSQTDNVANVQPSAQTTYTITVEDQCGTVASDVVTIDVEACDVIIPNVFSPNGDGYNDVFHIQNIEKFPNNRVEIYNRWGKKVFDADGYMNSWDGKIKGDGSEAAPGTYYYIIILDEERAPYSGHVTLTR